MMTNIDLREMNRRIEGFIECLDKIGFTCEQPEDIGRLGDALLSADDYVQLEKIMKEWSLNERIQQHT